MKTLKRVLSMAMALVLLVGGLAVLPTEADAEETEYEMLLLYGGDAKESNDWGYQYYGEGAETNAGEVTATTAKAKVGDTVEIGLKFPTATVYTWFMAPALVAPDTSVTNVDFTINSVKVDGTDILSTINMDARADGKWWYEETAGNKNVIRLAGGYNEWADKFITTSPSGFTEIVYSITLNAVETGTTGSSESVSYPADTVFDMLLLYGGDAKESNDWGYQYYGEGAETNAGEITATTAKVKIGETAEVGIKLPTAAIYTWFMAPAIIAPDALATSVDFTINSVKVDGTDILSTINMDARADGQWWYEETAGNKNVIRLAGGYNEWADKFIATSPTGFTEIVYSITLNGITYGAATEEPGETPTVDFDKNGKFNAYLGIQTPNWTYRNAWNTYEEGSELWGNFIYGNETGEKYGVVTDAVIAGNGTYKVSVVDFGTIFADDFSTAGQDYFNLLFISTDIPVGADVQITDVKLIIDGKTVHTDAEAYLDPDEKDYVKILIQNKWNADKAEISFYNAPQKSLEMEFTISGFDYDNAAENPSGGNTEDPGTTPDTDTNTSTNNEGGMNPVVIVVIVVVVVAIVAGVVVVLKKKQNK